MTGLRDRFAALVASGRADLGRAALEIARIGYPDLDPAPSLRRLDELAAAIVPRLGPGMAPDEVAQVATRYLFEERGFRGNTDEYYDPRNSFLNDVLERQTGIPISLSVIFMEVGTRVGLPVEGVGFPGHFLVRVAGRQGPILLDPFFGGRRLTEDELLERLRGTYGTRGPSGRYNRVPPDFLIATDTPGILTRMLRNLLRIFAETGRHDEALASVDLLLVLAPNSPEDIRTRGLLYERLECFAAAAADFRRYLDLVPEAEDAGKVRGRLLRVRREDRTVH